MTNDNGPLNTPFLAGLSIGISVAIFLALVLPPFDVITYCAAGESSLGCFREWAMMLATGGATLAAAWAAFYVARTLRETMRQTRFTVGDEPPSLELLPNHQQVESGRFRVVNWNRRPFFICELRWFADAKIVRMDVIEMAGRDAIVIEADHTLRHRIKVDGWENRSAAPPSVIAECGVILDIDNDDRDQWKGVTARLELVGYLSGEYRQRITLRAHAPLLELDLE